MSKSHNDPATPIDISERGLLALVELSVPTERATRHARHLAYGLADRRAILVKALASLHTRSDELYVASAHQYLGIIKDIADLRATSVQDG